jgi:hypothetical protein
MYSFSLSLAPALDADEATVEVALEGDEEEAGIELARARVDAVGVGVAAPQDPHAAVRGGRGQPDVASSGITGVPSEAFAARSTASRSRTPVSGAPLSLCRPIVRCCSSRLERSHVSISLRMRRVTT